MTVTLLLHISDAADECGISPRPDTVVNNTDDDIRRLLQMSNREGRELVKAADWTVLQRLHTITTTATVDEYPLPDDYGRLLRETEWDRTAKRPMEGPVNPQHWQSLKSSQFGASVIDKKFRIFRASTGVGRSVYIYPTPSVSGETLVFEYISSHFCVNADLVTTQDAWAADTDVAILDRDIMTLGLIIRFKRSVGLDFSSEAQEYEDIIMREKGQDRPSPTLSLTGRRQLRLLDASNLPETGIGS